MSVGQILGPVFAQVLLIVLLLAVMFVRRRADLASKTVAVKDISLRQPNWTMKATQAANSFSNQFEMPVLFYVLTILALITNQADALFVNLSWAFVATRYVHALEHVTTNVVNRRAAIYALGVAILLFLWCRFAVHVLTAAQ